MKWQRCRNIMATSLLTITASRKLSPNAPLLSPLPGTLPHQVANSTHRDQPGDKELNASVEQLARANQPPQKASVFLRHQHNRQRHLAEADAVRSMLKSEPCS